MTILCITTRFMQPLQHGRRDGGEPEWPPSPLRLYQALVAAAAARWNEREHLIHAVPAMRWLEAHGPPAILAPNGIASQVRTQFYVPDNTLDLCVPAWKRGEEKGGKRSEKVVQPTHLTGDAVHYMFRCAGSQCPHYDTLRDAAQSLTHLGWGIDMVVGNAELLTPEQASELANRSPEVWRPFGDLFGVPLRVPRRGTLDALIKKHEAFLNRLGPDGFRPVPPLTAFRVVHYRRTNAPVPQPFAAFTILKPDASSMRSFQTNRRVRDVAGMTRNAVSRVAHQQGWSTEEINRFVHGKSASGERLEAGLPSPDRFQYLPLPTINHALGRVESICRVLIAAPPQHGEKVNWLRRVLAGEDLHPEKNTEATGLLTILPNTDWVLRQYIEPATTWSSVTPVLLPGYDDPAHLRRKLHAGCDAETQKRYLARLDERIEELLRKAFLQAGYAAEIVRGLHLQWQTSGFRAGVDLASRYLPPANLSSAPRIHVQVRFPFEVPGPIAVGSGRFRGFGLFARIND